MIRGTKHISLSHTHTHTLFAAIYTDAIWAGRGRLSFVRVSGFLKTLLPRIEQLYHQPVSPLYTYNIQQCKPKLQKYASPHLDCLLLGAFV